MSGFKGDFLGFTYNGVHSSDLGIVRTSDGSRFNENLLPTIQDKTVQIPGGDGTYYFGSYYTQKPLTIQFAFDKLTEEKLGKIRRLFGDKQIHDLTFDETPYKAYRAKVTGTSTIKHIPFDEGTGHERVYKGEGSITFTCYDPYAVCRDKYLDYYSVEKCPNLNEWKEASGLRWKDQVDFLEDYTWHLYNPGVKESDCIITISTANCSGYELLLSGTTGFSLNWGDAPVPQFLIIDSKKNLILGAKDVTIQGSISKEAKRVLDGNIYNEFMTEGDFFKVPIGESEISIQKFDSNENNLELNSSDISVSYNYYYY